jgi:hypothetical protein
MKAKKEDPIRVPAVMKILKIQNQYHLVCSKADTCPTLVKTIHVGVEALRICV